ncbi:MAG: type II toxin-antitoxin system VapC family toxin [Terriglobia bacterium]|jgi:hypothetical protein
MIILDTNVLSELMKPAPSPRVAQWLGRFPPLGFFTTAVTQAEILYGLELLPKGKRRTSLQSAIEAMFAEEFAGRVLPFDSEAAQVFARIAFGRRVVGRPIAQSDAQIAAIANVRGAPIATRNTTDFDGCGITVLNPWID